MGVVWVRFFFFNIVWFGILRSLLVKSEDENAFYYKVQENITFLFCYLFEMTCIIYAHCPRRGALLSGAVKKKYTFFVMSCHYSAFFKNSIIWLLMCF